MKGRKKKKMASPFLFNTVERIGEDQCSQDITALQNTQTCNYYMQNYFVSDCNMTQAKTFATSQIGINYSGADMCGSTIDENSKLLIGGMNTHATCKLDLVPRPFATVPYMGRGATDVTMESEILRGGLGCNRKTVTKLSEQNSLRYQTTPLIPLVKRNIQQGQRQQRDTIDRGGLSSREMHRDILPKTMSMYSL